MKKNTLKQKAVVLMDSYIQLASAYAFEALNPAKPAAS